MAVPDLQDALALREQGRLREAAEVLERVVATLPAYAAARLVLAQTYTALGQREEALRAWHAARALLPGHAALADAYMQARVKLTQAAALPQTQTRELASSVEDDEAEETPPFTGILPDDAVPDAGGSLTEAPPRTERNAPFEGDLDSLIAELEAARIVPNHDLDDLPTPDLDPDVDDVVSETLARIYVGQGAHADAARAYARLAELHPNRAEEFETLAAEQREKAKDEEA